mmetsp:Transcript_15581/g.30497  ORF Transcript_15581/g.30497 Transcript_15581/m.30497 type:complete len:209 (-) Transcript_15581:135-761(-)
MMRWQFIQRYNDIGSNILLSLNGTLRSERHLRSIAITLKNDVIFRHRHRIFPGHIRSPMALVIPFLCALDDFPIGSFQLPSRLQRLLHTPVRQRKYLKSTAVRDERFLPPGEFVNPPGVADDAGPGLEEEVVGVGENELLAGVVGFGEIDGFERRVGPDCDEGGRVDGAVGGCDSSRSGEAFFGLVYDLKLEIIFRFIRPRWKISGRW